MILPISLSDHSYVPCDRTQLAVPVPTVYPPKDIPDGRTDHRMQAAQYHGRTASIDLRARPRYNRTSLDTLLTQSMHDASDRYLAHPAGWESRGRAPKAFACPTKTTACAWGAPVSPPACLLSGEAIGPAHEAGVFLAPRRFTSRSRTTARVESSCGVWG
jgi:hypothetical protein